MLGLDFGQTVSDVHPSLHGTGVEQSTNISNNTLEGLEQTILKLKIERKARILKVELILLWMAIDFLFSICSKIPFQLQLKDIVASLSELWNLMDSSREEKNNFSRIALILGKSESEITEQGFLSMEIVEQVWKLFHYFQIFYSYKLDPKVLLISFTGICWGGEAH